MLTIVTVNYNSADFIEVMLKALTKFTVNPWKMIICDNGSTYKDIAKLGELAYNYNNIDRFSRTQTKFGSVGNGEGLNKLIPMIDTEYGAILDADCMPLVKGWDQTLINQLNEKCPIAGFSPPCNTPVKKPLDFPLQFLTLFKTDIMQSLNIDFKPRDITKYEDTAWELRDKYMKAGFKSYTIPGWLTRHYKEGQFGSTICAEHYLGHVLFGVHFGRGSDPNSLKYCKNKLRRFIARFGHRADKKKWLNICNRIIDR